MRRFRVHPVFAILVLVALALAALKWGRDSTDLTYVMNRPECEGRRLILSQAPLADGKVGSVFRSA
jgi:hypothetical protein